jgi:hypothetical protein
MQVAVIIAAVHDNDVPLTPPRGGADAGRERERGGVEVGERERGRE